MYERVPEKTPSILMICRAGAEVQHEVPRRPRWRVTTYLITGLDKILQAAKDRKPGTDSALTVNETSRLRVAGRLNLLVQVEAGREALLVGGDEVNVHPEDSRIKRRQGIGSRRIDEDGRAYQTKRALDV